MTVAYIYHQQRVTRGILLTRGNKSADARPQGMTKLQTVDRMRSLRCDRSLLRNTLITAAHHAVWPLGQRLRVRAGVPPLLLMGLTVFPSVPSRATTFARFPLIFQRPPGSLSPRKAFRATVMKGNRDRKGRRITRLESGHVLGLGVCTR